MTTTNTYGRQVVIPLTNKSGGSVAAGDVVVVDASNNDAFTTDTSGGFTGGVGVAQETIANNATGRVLISGYAALVNVNASVTRGQYGKTHTVAKQATGTASRGAGTFCQWLTGGTTPDAIVYPVDLLGSSLTDPMTTRGDIIVRNAANAIARLAVGAARTVLGSDGTDPSWQPRFSGWRVYNNANIALTNGSGTLLTMNTEKYDTDAFHSIVTNTGRATIPAGMGGKYHIGGEVSMTASPSANAQIYLMLNGTTPVAVQPVSNDSTAAASISVDLDLAAADYVELFAAVFVGSKSALYLADYSPFFYGHRLD